MGYVTQTTRRPWLVLDVETTVIHDLDAYADDVRIDSRLKDPEKIAEAKAAARGKAAVDLDLARIVCTGLWASRDPAPTIWTGDTDEAERAQLAAWWQAYRDVVLDRGGQIVGYNILGFDLPLLIRRSQYLGVPTERVDLNKYRPGAICDLLNELSFAGSKPYRPLDFYVRRFGIAQDIPDATTGADMPALIAAGDWAAVQAHNLADLQRTQALAVRLGLIGPAAAQAGQAVA
jgi:hypothetical protein